VAYQARRRARRVWYRVEDALITARRVPAWVGRQLRRLWFGLSLAVRRAVAAIGAITIVAAAIWFLAVPALPCQFPGGDSCPPADDAANLVPGDALLYLHANVDPDGEQYQDAAALAARLPTIVEQLVAALPGLDGTSIDYRREVVPWLEGEVAIALLGQSGGRTEQALLLEVDDEQGAQEFADELTGRNARSEDYRGISIRGGDDLSTAMVAGFLVAGPGEAVRAAIDTELGEGRSLEDSEPADELGDELPDDSLADVFVSADGARDLFGAGAPLGAFEAFVNADATRGAGAALVAEQDGLELQTHSLLDPERLETSPGFFDAFAAFEPELAGELSSGALLYLGIGSPQQSVEALLAQAAAEAPGLVAGFEEFSERVEKSGKVNVQREVLALLGGEAAIAIEPPGEAAGGGEAGAAGGGDESEVPEGLDLGEGLPPAATAPRQLPFSGVPYLELVAEDVDEDEARRALADLQVPISEALDPDESGQAPVFEGEELEGVDVQSLRVSPTVNLTYALFDGKLVVATDPAGVRQVRTGSDSLEDSAAYERATEGFPDELSALLYLNLTDLITLAEQEGLAADPAYALFAPEIRELDALGLAVTRSEEEIEARVRLIVAE
jgi:Protein of unknown function (DUF3352)